MQLLLQPCRNSGTGSDAGTSPVVKIYSTNLTCVDRGVFCLEGLLNERNVIEGSCPIYIADRIIHTNCSIAVSAVELALETQRSKALVAMDTFQQWPKVRIPAPRKSSADLSSAGCDCIAKSFSLIPRSSPPCVHGRVLHRSCGLFPG